jgi:hypothetical protein
MNKFLPFLLAGIIASPVLAQQSGQRSINEPEFIVSPSAFQYNNQQTALPAQSTLDTLDQYFFRSTGFGVYSYSVETEGGTIDLPITGTNDAYQFLGAKYDFSGKARVQSVLVAYASKFTQGTPDNFIAAIFSLPSTSFPVMSQLGAQEFSADLIDTNSTEPSFTVIDFENPVAIGSNFVVMIQTINPAEGANLDFISIYSNEQGNGQGEKRASVIGINEQGEMYNADLADIFNTGGELLDIDPMIIPIIEVDGTSGVEDYATLNGLTLKGAYPSPASQNTTVHFALDKPSFVEISIIDMTGQIVSTVRHNTMEAGNHTLDLDVSTLPTGSYMYAISTKTARVAGKLAVTR